jgi:hypothetical protein
MADEQIRYGLLVRETLEVLRDAPAPMQYREVTAMVGQRIFRPRQDPGRRQCLIVNTEASHIRVADMGEQ